MHVSGAYNLTLRPNFHSKICFMSTKEFSFRDGYISRQRNAVSEEKDSSTVSDTEFDVVTSKPGRNGDSGSRFKVVITGSTKGIGMELAREFLAAGDDVVVSSRYGSSVKSAVKTLQSEYENSNIIGVICDVTKQKEVANLADYCRDELGGVNFWINNAGSNAYQYKMLTEFEEEELRQILDTNILGVMLGCKEAIRIMCGQNINGHILNMDGAGANGRPTPRFAAYGATKRAIMQFNDSINEELKMQNITNIGVHNISAGMCTTDLLMSGIQTAEGKFFINCLAEDPSVPAKYLVPLVRMLPQEKYEKGIKSQNLEYLTQVKAFTQILRRLVLQERKNRYIQED